MENYHDKTVLSPYSHHNSTSNFRIREKMNEGTDFGAINLRHMLH